MRDLDGKYIPPEIRAQWAELAKAKHCPICKQSMSVGWTGIDAHWRANHEDVMPYEEAREHYKFNQREFIS